MIPSGIQATCKAALLLAAVAGLLVTASAAAAGEQDGAASPHPASAADPADDEITAADYALAEVSPAARERLLAKLPRFRSATGAEYVILEGDLRYTEAEVRAIFADRGFHQFTRSLRETNRPVEKGILTGVINRSFSAFQPDLIIKLPAPGKQAIWPQGQRSLTFAVDKASFARAPDLYPVVVTNISKAAAQWEALCNVCGVTIRYRPELDSQPTQTRTTFVVRYDPQPSAFDALAFFPASPAAERVLWVFSRYTSSDYDRTGIFRHEIGHILGYAHEHVANRTGCAKSGGQWRAITEYDPKSVMHYLCGSEGRAELSFTDLDKTGHFETYGP